jgi:hypothetical protein
VIVTTTEAIAITADEVEEMITEITTTMIIEDDGIADSFRTFILKKYNTKIFQKRIIQNL